VIDRTNERMIDKTMNSKLVLIFFFQKVCMLYFQFLYLHFINDFLILVDKRYQPVMLCCVLDERNSIHHIEMVETPLILRNDASYKLLIY